MSAKRKQALEKLLPEMEDSVFEWQTNFDMCLEINNFEWAAMAKKNIDRCEERLLLVRQYLNNNDKNALAKLRKILAVAFDYHLPVPSGTQQ